MADQEYKVKLDDEISPGLQRIISLLEKIETKTSKATKQPKAFTAASKAIAKTSKTTEKSTKSFEKLDKTLNVFSTPIGQIAGKFGFMGDLIEASSGKMIGMGGAVAGLGVAILGVGATVGIFAAGLYGIGKAAFYFDSVTKGMNKTLLTTMGNLGKYHAKTKEVVDASLQMNARLGQSYEQVAGTISTAVKAGATVEQGKQLAYVSTVMEQFGDVGSKFNKTLNEVYAGRGKLQSSDDIARLLMQTGAINKEMSITQKYRQIQLFKTSNTKKQLEMLTKNREQMEKLKKTAEATVPASEKIKQAFITMFTKALGQGGSLDSAIENLIKWTEKQENIDNITKMFTGLSDTFKNVLSNAGPLFDKIMSIVNASYELLKVLGLIQEKGNTKEFLLVQKLKKETETNVVTVDKSGKIIATPKSTEKPKTELIPKTLPKIIQAVPIQTEPGKTSQLQINSSIVPDYTKELQNSTAALNKLAENKPAPNVTQTFSFTINEANDPVKTAETVKKMFQDQRYAMG